MAAAAIAIHIFIPTKAAAIVGALLIGSSYGNVFSFGFAYAPMVVPKSRADEATGVASALTVGPWFISTYLMTWLMDGVFKTGAGYSLPDRAAWHVCGRVRYRVDFYREI